MAKPSPWRGKKLRPLLHTAYQQGAEALDELAVVVNDTAYDATSWNGVTDMAPSKNAVRDKIEAMISDTAYDATSWNGVTTIAPSQNAVRDKFEAVATANEADYTKSFLLMGG